MKKIFLLAALASFGVSCASNGARWLTQPTQKQTETLPAAWQFRQAGADKWMPATVPGVVHTDLLANGVIEEPYASTNEPKLQWIEMEEWEYATVFTPSAELLADAVQELVFYGLDTYADVYLNDSLLLKADNMFVTWRLPVKGILKQGENRLRILFRSAYKEGLELAKAWPVKLPADNDKGADYKTSVFTRKAPYHFGWDWGPRYATVGVWRPVELQGYQAARIDNVQFLQKSQSAKLAEFDVHVTLDGAISARETPCELLIMDSTGKVYGSEFVPVFSGKQTITVPVSIKNPKLWWPNGMGEPNLYHLTAVLTAGREKLDQQSQQVGVRTVRLVQQPDPTGKGVSFYFEVNGQPCFAKGANYIPQDLFLPRVTPAKYRELVGVARESNMNMLRVWGGGIYEDDAFYQECDRQGIMVWQDFMFACSFYPWDEKFLESVRTEAIQNVRRLRNHPSIAIWCGNNEISEAWYHWGYARVYKWSADEKQAIWDGYKALFEGVLPQVLKAEDTTRYYHPSSPLYGRGNPLSQIAGDVHYWGVFHDEEPFSVYKDKPGRFSNEYGFQSLACYDTYREYFKAEDMKLYSEAMVIHQKNPKGYRVIEEYMVRDLPLLKDDFRTYVYLTQLLQAEGIKIAMEGHRMKRPFTMGSLYWQLNDCWPVASWSSLDSEMRWKALQYYARRSFAPTGVYFEKVDSSQTAVLWAITDRLQPQRGEVKLTLMDFEGNVKWSETKTVDLAANSNLELLRKKESSLLQGADPRTVLLVAEGQLNGQPMRAIHYFVPLKDLALPKADYTANYVEQGDRVLATIKAKTLVKSLLFEAEAIQGNPSDAYFDLLPGEERTIELHFKEAKPVGELGIFVRSLNDLAGRPSETPITKNVQ